MTYARAHDQKVAQDYFAAMSRVEQRMEIAPVVQEAENEVVKVPENVQILAWIEQLAQPELRQQERLEIAWSLKQALSRNLASSLAPPIANVVAA